MKYKISGVVVLPPIDTQQPFITAAKAQTMLRDFDKLRKAIRAHDSFAAEEAFDYCERWISQLKVVSKYDTKE